MADDDDDDDKEEVLEKKTEALKEDQAVIEREMSRLFSRRAAPVSPNQRSHSVSPQRSSSSSSSSSRSGFRSGLPAATWRRGSSSFPHASPLQRESGFDGGGAGRRERFDREQFTDMRYWKILQSMGQAVHIMDLDGRITYWNRSAEVLYGYSEAEALGEDAMGLLIDTCDFEKACNIINRIVMGEGWTGKFPAKKKSGERFLAVVTNTPSRDDEGNVVGIICVSNDSCYFQDSYATLDDKKSSSTDICSNQNFSGPTSKGILDLQQPIQVAITSKLPNLASKVTNKARSHIKTSDNNMLREIVTANVHPFDHDQSNHKEHATSIGASTPREEISVSHFTATPFKEAGSSNEIEGNPGIPKIISSKAEGWIDEKGMPWPWKGIEREAHQFVKPLLGADLEDDLGEQKNLESNQKLDQLSGEFNQLVNNEASGSWPSFNVNSTSSISSSGSTSSSTVYKVDIDVDCLDCEILWEDLTIGEHIGHGSCGTVYRAFWYGSDVAVKIFSKQEYSDEVIMSFRQEVSLMKRLRHPNVILFMGAVTSPEHLCIVTEFLPRGSLFRLLQRSSPRLEWRRRVHMALDIARGVNYLHHLNPPIIHQDLKSSNLLVDKNWTVKVGDFGLSCLKHETYLTTKTGKGTPQWMAPEVLRDEPSDEKSDVYSFGVILWELVTEKIPWDNLNSMQVIAAVAFMNRRLEIPEDTDTKWVSIIESCWHSEPELRPSFQELLERLRDLKRYYNHQLLTSRAAASGDNTTQKTPELIKNQEAKFAPLPK